MSLNRYATRKDLNQDELVTVARRCGFQIEWGAPLDFWAGLKGIWKPIEIKGRNGRYTPSQVTFMERCKRAGNPHQTWRDVGDVIKAANTWSEK